MMEGTSGAAFQVCFSRSYLKGFPKAHQALALGGRGGVIKTKYRTVARETRSSFSRASLRDNRCPSTNRLG